MIWIPRPKVNGLRLQAELEKCGISSVCLPLIDIEILPITDMSQVKACAQLIFFSRYSVEALFSQGYQKSDGQVLIAIGPGTAAALAKVGAPTNFVTPAPHDSDALIEFYLSLGLHGLTGLVTGEYGRQRVFQFFTQKNLPVTTFVFYRRILPDISEKSMLEFLTKYRINAIVITSVSMLESLTTRGENVMSSLSNVQIFANSQRVAKACRKTGFSRVTVSKDASQNALVNSILSNREEK